MSGAKKTREGSKKKGLENSDVQETKTSRHLEKKLNTHDRATSWTKSKNDKDDARPVEKDRKKL